MTNQIIRFTFRIPSKLLKKIEIEAKEDGISRNAKMLEILKNNYKNQKEVEESKI